MTRNRGWVELTHRDENAPQEVPAAGWPVGPTVRVLSRDAADGDFTGILSLPVGYRRPLGHYPVECDLLVLSGALRIGDRVRGTGFYQWTGAGATQEPWTVEADTELLFMPHVGAPDFVPAAGDGTGLVEVDTEAEPWVASDTPGPPPGLVHKELRRNPETGERCWISGIVPDYDYPKIEWHDCIEEIYCLDGDIWLANSGTMTPGSYLWRPGYISHGGFRSEDGCRIFVWVDSKLINHFVDDPSTTPEENRRTAQGGA